jgi:hypothetical protein
MEVFEVGPWTVDAEPESTRQAYAAIQAIHCDCAHCVNFLTADVYPDAFLDLLRRLGVDADKEDEVSEYGPGRGEGLSWWSNYKREREDWREWKWLYMGWFWALGRVSGPPAPPEWDGVTTGDAYRYEIGVTPSFSYELGSHVLSSLREGPPPVKGSPFDTGDSFRIEFMADAVPWVLETPPWKLPPQEVA